MSTTLDLEAWVMDALLNQPLHGYRIRKHVRDATERRLSPSLGSIYTVLRRLERSGCLEIVETGQSSHGPPRKCYKLTGKGEVEYNERRRLYAALTRHVSVG